MKICVMKIVVLLNLLCQGTRLFAVLWISLYLFFFVDGNPNELIVHLILTYRNRIELRVKVSHSVANHLQNILF